MPENEEEYINKLEKIFEENYLKPENDNRIYSISSMLLLTSYYFGYKAIEPEKLKKFKSWFLQLSEKESSKYFDKIYNLIVGGNIDINDILEISNNFQSNENDDLNQNKFVEKKEKEINSSTSINLMIHQNIYIPLANIAGYESLIKKKKKNNEKLNNNDSQENQKQNILNPKKNIKINIKVNLEANEKEIENIKNNMRKEKYFNTYYCFLDDIKNRCFIYNPKNILIKRFFSHIFYRLVLFHQQILKISN